MIEKLTEFFSNPFYSFLLATLVGILSNFLTGIITGKYFDRTKRLWWGVDHEWLRDFYFDETGKLRITYIGLDNRRKEIRNLAVLRFVFWSNGKDTLANTDISSKEPLIIALEPNIELLEIRPITSSNPTILIKPISKNTLSIDFEYLKTNQGAVFDMVVSGFAKTAVLNGVLKGGQVLTKELRPSAFIALPFFPKKWEQHTRITVSKWVFTSFLILTLWGSFILTQGIIQKPDNKDAWFILLQIVFSVIPYLIIVYPFWTTPIVPKELKGFYERIT